MGSARLKRILDFSFGTLASRALWAIYDQSDNFILGKVGGAVALGFYTMARDLASIPVTRISTVVNMLSVPLMANLQDDPAGMRNVLVRGIRLTASVSVPICVGIAVVAEDLVRVALSEKWMPIVTILRILCGIALVKSIDVLIAPVLRARYRTTFLTAYNLALLVVMPIAFIAGAYLAGGVGVAYAWLAAYPLVMARMAAEALREIDLPWRSVLRQLQDPLWAAALMTLAALGMQALVPGAGFGASLARLLLASTVGAAVYATALWIRGGPLRDEMLEVLSWIFKPRRSRPG
jgi:PST family polysaccharide transporter